MFGNDLFYFCGQLEFLFTKATEGTFERLIEFHIFIIQSSYHPTLIVHTVYAEPLHCAHRKPSNNHIILFCQRAGLSILPVLSTHSLSRMSPQSALLPFILVQHENQLPQPRTFPELDNPPL